MHKQIFHDPTGRRKVLLWTVILGLAAVMLVTAGTLVARIATIEYHVAPAFPGHMVNPATSPEMVRPDIAPANDPSWLPVETIAGSQPPERFAFYMPWDEVGRASLTENIGHLDVVVAGLATVHGARHVWRQEHDPHLRTVVNGGQIPGHCGGVKAGHCDAGLTI